MEKKKDKTEGEEGCDQEEVQALDTQYGSVGLPQAGEDSGEEEYQAINVG